MEEVLDELEIMQAESAGKLLAYIRKAANDQSFSCYQVKLYTGGLGWVCKSHEDNQARVYRGPTERRALLSALEAVTTVKL